MDSVRLQHLSILLAAGGGSRDEEAEQMVPQVLALCCAFCCTILCRSPFYMLYDHSFGAKPTAA